MTRGAGAQGRRRAQSLDGLGHWIAGTAEPDARARPGALRRRRTPCEVGGRVLRGAAHLPQRRRPRRACRTGRASPACRPHQQLADGARRAARAPGDPGRRLHRARIRPGVCALRQRGDGDRARRPPAAARGRRGRRECRPCSSATASRSASARTSTALAARRRAGIALDRRRPARGDRGSHLLVAVGRRPNTEDLDLARAGVARDAHGNITVDDQLRTNVPGIWALGDVNGRGAFTHTSYNDYEIVAANLLDDDPRRVSDRVPAYALYTDPPLGRVGMSRGRGARVGQARAGRPPADDARRPRPRARRDRTAS